MLSRILGLVRDMIISSFVGTASRDAFLLAFKLPNMLRDLVGEGAMNAAFVPVFSRTLATKSEKDFRELVSATMAAMIILLLVLTILGVALVPILIQGLNLLTPITGGATIDADKIELMRSLTRWTFPYLFFIGLTVFAMGPLFTVRHYATPSWSPALLNIAIIASCLLFYKRFSDPAYALVLGVWLGGIAQLVAQYWALAKYTGVRYPSFRLDHPAIWTIIILMGPVILGQAAGEVNKLVDILFARSIGDGIVSAFYYANRLVQLPLSIFGAAVAAAILPSLSQSAARNRLGEIRDTLMHGFRQSFFVLFPALLGLLFFGRPIIMLLFDHGKWGPLDTDYTTRALTIYSLGLLSFAGVKIGIGGFFCAGDTKTPVIVASASMLLNIVLNLLLVRPLGYQGLALATTISFTVNFVVLYRLLGKRYGELWDAPFLTALLRMIVAGALMAALTYAVYVRVLLWVGDETFLARAVTVLAICTTASASYAAMCRALGVEELSHFTAILRGRSEPE